MSGASEAEGFAWHESRPTFTQLPDWLLTHPEVSDAALRTWLVLAHFADREGQAFPGVAAVAAKRSKSRRQVFEHLDQLERAGALRRHARYRADGRGRTSTLYVLAWAYPLVNAPETMGAENRTHGMGAENRTGGMSARNRTGARAENLTPRTRPKKEQDPPTPAAHHEPAAAEPPGRRTSPRPHPPEEANGSQLRPTSADRSRPQRLTSRALGTNPRARAQQAAEASRRAEAVRAARSFGARTAVLEPVLSADELRQRLVDDATRDPIRGWDDQRIEACVAGFDDERASIAHEQLAMHPVPAELTDRGSALSDRIARIARRTSQLAPSNPDEHAGRPT